MSELKSFTDLVVKILTPQFYFFIDRMKAVNRNHLTQDHKRNNKHHGLTIAASELEYWFENSFRELIMGDCRYGHGPYIKFDARYELGSIHPHVTEFNTRFRWEDNNVKGVVQIRQRDSIYLNLEIDNYTDSTEILIKTSIDDGDFVRLVQQACEEFKPIREQMNSWTTVHPSEFMDNV